MSLALMTFLLRLMARVITGKVGMDDWTMVVVMVPATDAGRLL